MRQLCALAAKGDSILSCIASRSMDPFPLSEPSGCCVQFWTPEDKNDVDVLEASSVNIHKDDAKTEVSDTSEETGRAGTAQHGEKAARGIVSIYPMGESKGEEARLYSQ